ncbi:uncharacterized protein PV09_08293 [Verruconis gallopava]|uniref:Heterokaryon incompatibility domain-containing protein n=1 Tax=Verruconis gallopava TaxID=253628 RepID=A0A0D2A0F3_9PEZI|nr:uncharacterized protein PV09_08293 [Verruconis gallopava]KIW00108.1 hypothetical protein PV09_08293 [Verruconis gallopava]
MTSEEYARVMGNSWATRLWTVQEHVLATKVKVVCGHATAELKGFSIFCIDGLRPLQLINVVEIYECREWHQRWNARDVLLDIRQTYLKDRCSFNFEQDIESKVEILLYAPVTSQLNNASDPKDKLFAMYGLLEGIVSSLPRVNYLESKEKIYEDFTRNTITSFGHFWPSLLDVGMMNLQSSLSSWVSDPSYRQESEYEAMDAILYHFRSSQIRPLPIDPNLCSIQDSKPGVVSVRGCTLGIINKIGQKWPGHNESIILDLQCLQSWQDFFHLNTRLPNPNANGEHKSTSFLKLISFGRPSTELESWELQAPKMMDWFQDLNLLSGACNFKEVEEEIITDERKRNFFNMPNLARSVIFSVSDGKIGTTRAEIAIGDSVVLLASSILPVLFRPQGEHWRYVGPAYIDGAMDWRTWICNIDSRQLEIFSPI